MKVSGPSLRFWKSIQPRRFWYLAHRTVRSIFIRRCTPAERLFAENINRRADPGRYSERVPGRKLGSATDCGGLVRRMASPQLTRRELEVLTAMAEGKSNREIGEALKVSEGTVKVHMTHILEKLQVDGRTGAMAAAAARGLVTLVARPTLKDSHGVNESKPTDSARRNFRDPSNGNLARVS